MYVDDTSLILFLILAVSVCVNFYFLGWVVGRGKKTNRGEGGQNGKAT